MTGTGDKGGNGSWEAIMNPSNGRMATSNCANQNDITNYSSQSIEAKIDESGGTDWTTSIHPKKPSYTTQLSPSEKKSLGQR